MKRDKDELEKVMIPEKTVAASFLIIQTQRFMLQVQTELLMFSEVKHKSNCCIRS